MHKLLITLCLAALLLSACAPALPEQARLETAVAGTLAAEPPMPELVYPPTATRTPVPPTASPTPTPTATLEPTLTPSATPSPTADLRVWEVAPREILLLQDDFPLAATRIRYTTDQKKFPWMSANAAQAYQRRTGVIDRYESTVTDVKSYIYQPWCSSYVYRFGSVQGAQAALQPDTINAILTHQHYIVFNDPDAKYEYRTENGQEQVIVTIEGFLNPYSGDYTRTLHYIAVSRYRNLVLQVACSNRAKTIDPEAIWQRVYLMASRAEESGDLLEPTATPSPTPPPTATTAPTLGPTPTPWPDGWLVQDGPKGLELSRNDLLYPDIYMDYKSSTSWWSFRGEKPVYVMRGEEDFGSFGPNTGFVKSAASRFMRQTFVSQRMPREIYSYVLQFKTEEGALKALEEYNVLVTNPEKARIIQSHVRMDLGDHYLVVWQDTGASKEKPVGTYTVLFVYRNYLVEVGGYGYEYEVPAQVLEQLAQNVLLKLQAAAHGE
jgi:hypothetical protein